MIIGVFLFMVAFAIGYLLNLSLAIALPIVATVLVVILWLVRQKFAFFEFLVLVGHLLAFHSGYLLGAHLADRKRRREVRARAQNDGVAEAEVTTRRSEADRLH